MKNSALSILIRNLFWIIPLIIIIGLWDYTAPILIQLILASIGMIIFNPVVNLLESRIQNRGLSILILLILLALLIIFSMNLIWPILNRQFLEIQSLFTTNTYEDFLHKIEMISNKLLPSMVFIKFKALLISLDYIVKDFWVIISSDIQSIIGKASSVILVVGSMTISFIFIIVFFIFL